ncbi:MAG: hypothetical protein ACO1RT_05280 [Planctomycetaceae bacterium]
MNQRQQPLNPYAVDTASNANAGQHAAAPLALRRGMIGHVPILAVLMIAQGGLVVLMGLAFAGYAYFMPALLREMQQQAVKQGGQGAAMPPQMPVFMTTIGVTLAVLILLVGATTIYSGINVFRYRGRTMAMVSLGAGLCLIFTCYCFPTAIALAIYGLLTLLDPSVRHAFEMREQGVPAEEIQRSFAGLP